MRTFLILLLLCFSIATPYAIANDIFLKKHKSEDQIAKEEMEKSLELHEKSNKNSTDTLSSKELANKYFTSCMSKHDPIMTKFSQEMLCGCTSAKIQETMNIEEIRAMFTNTKEGAFQRSRVMAFIYVPCMEYPVYDLLNNECIGNEEIRKNLKNYNKVCSCLAENMSKFITKEGSNILSSSPRNNIPNPDALMQSTLADFMNSEAYERKASYHTSVCIQKHEFGW